MKSKSKCLKGVTVRFERIDEEDNVIEVLCEKTFPDKSFTVSHSSISNCRNYHCWDKEVSDYVYKQHIKYDCEFHYADWDNAPNIRQAFYNEKNELMYTQDEVEYEMNL